MFGRSMICDCDNELECCACQDPLNQAPNRTGVHGGMQDTRICPNDNAVSIKRDEFCQLDFVKDRVRER